MFHSDILISHSRGVHQLLLLLLEVADAVDGGEGIVSVGHPDTHGVVLIGYGGAGAQVCIQDVLTLGHEAPLAVLRGVAERGVEPQEGVDVVEALDSLRLEEGVEDKLDVVPLRELDHSLAAEDT